MKKKIGCFFIVSAWMTFFSATIVVSEEAYPPKLPLSYFTKRPETRIVKLSPDGKHLVIITNKKNKDIFSILDSQTRKIITTINLKGEGNSISNVDWVNNNRLAYSTTKSYRNDKRSHRTGELMAVNFDGSGHDIIFSFGQVNSNLLTRIKKPRERQRALHGTFDIINFLEDDDNNILITFHASKKYADQWRNDPNKKSVVYKLNVYSGKRRKVTMLPFSRATAITDNNSHVRFAIGRNKNNEVKVAFKEKPDSNWQDFELKNFKGRHLIPRSFASDNQRVYMSANVNHGTRALYLVNLVDQSVEKIFHDETVDIARYVYDFTGQKIIAVETELNLPKYHYIDDQDPKVKLHKQLMKKFVGNDVYITSSSINGEQLIAFVYADKNPGDYYLINSKTKTTDYLVSQSPWVNINYSASIEPIQFTSRDNQIIYGYLTHPESSKKEPFPLVIIPHGGPHGIRNFWNYDWEAQLLANRGYAVLQVNFRGSGGFGQKFQESGYGEWGGIMQDDITDATHYLIDRKIVDPNRICIYGTSYGGYSALMGAVKEPDLYRCAIGNAGVYDLPMMFAKGHIARFSISGQAYLKEVIGDDEDDIKSRSPVYQVAKIKADILLIHGTLDSRAPIEQVKSLKAAFDNISKTYEWYEVKDEGHGFFDGKNREAVYIKILDFLERNIGISK